MSNEDLDRQLYKYPDSDVLRNKFNIQDSQALDRLERQLATDRITEGVPSGKFDLDHLCAIHHHIFQDIYEWAGELRKVDFHKGDMWFHPKDRIGFAMLDVHKRLTEQSFLKSLTPEEYARQAGVIIGDINLIHPFREGNGRTQLQYLKQLTNQAGHSIDLSRLQGKSWIKASIEANKAEYGLMQDCISKALVNREKVKKQPANPADKIRQKLKHDKSKDDSRSR